MTPKSVGTTELTLLSVPGKVLARIILDRSSVEGGVTIAAAKDYTYNPISVNLCGAKLIRCRNKGYQLFVFEWEYSLSVLQT